MAFELNDRVMGLNVRYSPLWISTYTPENTIGTSGV